jgi:23S rRNA (guanosine2251-2'-O)-methyltransferase
MKTGKKKFKKKFPPRSDSLNSPNENSNSNLIYGISPVIETLNAERRSVERILIAEGKQHKKINEIIGLARKHNIRFQTISRQKFSSFLEPQANHQGVIAFTSPASYYDAGDLLNEIKAKETSLCVILDGVEDPHNLGAIIRSVECVGADGVFIPERRAVGLTETVVKSSAGATEHIRIAKVPNINNLIDELKENNIWVVGTDGYSAMNYTEWDFCQPTAIVLGSEGKGISRLTAEKCDVLVKIPLFGKIESLNVSVATGVVLFEAIRQRNLKK